MFGFSFQQRYVVSLRKHLDDLFSILGERIVLRLHSGVLSCEMTRGGWTGADMAAVSQTGPVNWPPPRRRRSDGDAWTGFSALPREPH